MAKKTDEGKQQGAKKRPPSPVAIEAANKKIVRNAALVATRTNGRETR